MYDFTENQKRDIIFFENNLKSFLENDLLKFKHVVISNEKLQNCFDTLDAALTYAVDRFQRGDYIIQQIIDEEEVINYVKAVII
jgi:hypothetical protein